MSIIQVLIPVLTSANQARESRCFTHICFFTHGCRLENQIIILRIYHEVVLHHFDRVLFSSFMQIFSISMFCDQDIPWSGCK